MNKKKLSIIIIFVVTIALCIGGGVTAFLLNYNIEEAPALEIYEQNEKIYAKTDMSGQYKGSRFKLEVGQTSLYLESQGNSVCLSDDERIKSGDRLKVSVCLLGQSEGGNTKYSAAQELIVYSYLKAPRVFYNDLSQVLSWSAIEDASYYEVYFGAQVKRVYETEFDLGAFDGGRGDVFVVACSNVTHHKTSGKSNIIKDAQVRHKLKPFTEIKFDKESLTLTLKGVEEVSAINIYINDKKPVATKFTKEEKSGQFVYTLDLTAVFTDGCEKIGASPVPADEFQIFEGEVLYYNLAA